MATALALLPTETLDAPETRAAARPPRLLELETISSRWQLALDAAQKALDAAGRELPASELATMTRKLGEERTETAEALRQLAHVAGVHPAPWLSQVPVGNELLGLPASLRACVFDLEGVLTDSGLLHAWAWGEVLDQYLLPLSERAHWTFVRFDRDADYRAYFEGRPRLEGIHAFLASRGIRLPEGRFDDRAGADTAYGLARRKGELFSRELHRRGSTALPGARRYLQAAGHAGLDRCVVSASSSTSRLLELSGLTALVEACVDADVIQAEGLRSRPAPDALLAACARLAARPDEAVTFTHTPAGVAAGREAGLMVIGVGEGEQGERLRHYGAEPVVPSLDALLDSRLSGGSPRRGRTALADWLAAVSIELP